MHLETVGNNLVSVLVCPKALTVKLLHITKSLVAPPFFDGNELHLLLGVGYINVTYIKQRQF